MPLPAELRTKREHESSPLSRLCKWSEIEWRPGAATYHPWCNVSSRLGSSCRSSRSSRTSNPSGVVTTKKFSSNRRFLRYAATSGLSGKQRRSEQRAALPILWYDMKSPEDPASVDEALDRYWLDSSLPGHCPDYLGFYDWVTRHLDEIKSGVPLPLHSGASSYSRLPLELARAAKAAGIQITRDAAAPDPKRFAKWGSKQSKLKRLNKSKLLLSYLSDSSPRWREVLLTLSKADLSADSLPRSFFMRLPRAMNSPLSK